jgi:beta-lactamase class D
MKCSITLAMALATASVGLPSHARADTICTAVEDVASGRVLTADGDCDRRVTPASTFKIAISLMGFDAGVLKDPHDPALPYDDGYAAGRPEWKQITNPTSWMARSVVWYSQQTTTALGEARFVRYVREFEYGDQDVSGGLTRAWLSSSLQISPLEQVGFLRRMLQGRLPVSRHAVEMTERITALPEPIDGWTVHGKTGSGAPRTADGGYERSREFGWFVGWAVKGARRVTFAHLVQAEGSTDEPTGMRARRELLAALPALLREQSR